MTFKLMIKTHNTTGLKYLCKTTRSDKYYKWYKGSGTAWREHLREFGSEITTELIFESDDIDEFSKVALAKSIELNVVDSDKWANLVHESGGIGHHSYPDSIRKKISESNKGKIMSLEARQRISLAKKGKPGTKHTEESKEKMRKPKPPGHGEKVSIALRGYKHSNETRERMKKPKSDEHKKKISETMTGKKLPAERVQKAREGLINYWKRKKINKW